MPDITAVGGEPEAVFQQIKARIMANSPAAATARKDYWEDRRRLLGQMEAELETTARMIEERLSSRAAQQFNLRLRRQRDQQAEHAQLAQDTALVWQTVAAKLREAQARIAAIETSAADATARRVQAQQVENELRNAYLTAAADLGAWRPGGDTTVPAEAAPTAVSPAASATTLLPPAGVAAAAGVAVWRAQPKGPVGETDRAAFAEHPATPDRFPLNPAPIPVPPAATPAPPPPAKTRPAPEPGLPPITFTAVESAVADLLIEAGSSDDVHRPHLEATVTLMTMHAREASLLVKGVGRALGERSGGVAIARIDLDGVVTSGDVWSRLGDGLDKARPRPAWRLRLRRAASGAEAQRRRVAELADDVRASGALPVFLLPDTSTLPVGIVEETLQALSELTDDLDGPAVALVALDLPRLADELSRDRRDPKYGPGRVAPVMSRLFELPPAGAPGRPRSAGALMLTSGGLPQGVLASARQSVAPDFLRADQHLRAAWLWSLYHRLLGPAGARLAEPTLAVAMFAVAFYDVAVQSRGGRPRAGMLLRAYGDEELWDAEVRAAGLDTPGLEREVWSLWELLRMGGDRAVELGRHLLPALPGPPRV
ncbi:hypothetical protein [Micromonospora echinaurantiaca]|uniref:hypothetical protein n=1 Tax=Micromonospora echinaurantiaca TaxID=47857 RepID=UPI0037992EC8